MKRLLLVLSLFMSLVFSTFSHAESEGAAKENLLFNRYIDRLINSDRHQALKEQYLGSTYYLKRHNETKGILQQRHIMRLLRKVVARLSFTNRGHSESHYVDICPRLLADDKQAQLKHRFPNFDRRRFLQLLELLKTIVDVNSETNASPLDSRVLGGFIYARFSGRENVNPNPDLDIDCSHEWLDYFLAWPEFDVNRYKKNTSLMSFALSSHNEKAVNVVLRHGYKIVPHDYQLLLDIRKNILEEIDQKDLGPVSDLEAQKTVEATASIKRILEQHERDL